VQFGARVEYVTENGSSGCKVQQVARGTSVALQLQEKDLILKIGNSTFASTDEFIGLFMEYSPDQEVQLTVLRGKKKLVLKAFQDQKQVFSYLFLSRV
jgi:S1-C subfamily serine protease